MESTSTGSGKEDDSQQQHKNLNAKYQKLAAEYAKLRSQVQVLKKAVIEEQSKQAGLKSTITTQDQRVRKLEQELDSVTFRNRQLERRVEVLQEENKSSSKGGSQQQQIEQQNLDSSSLLLHVEQNKCLQEQLALLNEKYATDVGRLRRMIDHEMVPKELHESISRENNERVVLLNRRVAELVDVNQELRGKVDGLEEAQRRGDENEGSGSRGIEIDELVKKLTESELGREKLNSDVQILRLKLKRLGGAGSSSEEGGSVLTSPINDEKSNMIGRLIVVGDNSFNNFDVELVTHLRSRVTELVRLLQLSDSKSVHYYSECVSLCRLVRSSQVTYKRLEVEFGKLKARFRAVTDELEDTKKGYEGQVSCLTEHIALLNEKLASCVEEVGVLKSNQRAK